MSARPADTAAPDVDEGGSQQQFEFDPRGVHLAFLSVFTYLLQDYRKYDDVHPSSHFPPSPL
jgi:hypothetical protein